MSISSAWSHDEKRRNVFSRKGFRDTEASSNDTHKHGRLELGIELTCKGVPGSSPGASTSQFCSPADGLRTIPRTSAASDHGRANSGLHGFRVAPDCEPAGNDQQVTDELDVGPRQQSVSNRPSGWVTITHLSSWSREGLIPKSRLRCDYRHRYHQYRKKACSHGLVHQARIRLR